MLFDCGEGTLRQLINLNSVPSDFTGIYISHLHGDHIFGLPSLLLHINEANNNADSTTSRGGGGDDKPHVINVYGPEGLYNFICSIIINELISTNPFNNLYPEIKQNKPLKELSYDKIIHNYINSDDTGLCWELPMMMRQHGRMRIKAAAIKHSIPTLGFVVKEDDLEGAIDVEKAKSLGLSPGPLYRKLKEGLDVTLEDGTIIKSKDCVGPSTRGRKITILGDTCDASNMIPYAQHSDILVHEATVEDGMIEAKKRRHSTPKMAGIFASKIKAKRLVLTHFSKRINHGSFRPFVMNCDWDSPGLPKLTSHHPVTGKSFKPHHDEATMSHVEKAVQAFKNRSVMAAQDFVFVPIPRGGFKK